MQKFTTLKQTLYKIYIPVILFLAVVFGISLYVNIPIEDLTRDPNAVSETHPFVGAVSNIGIFIWCFTLAVCFFMSVLIKKEGDKSFLSFFIHSALITLLLLVDDAFMLHETVLPDYFNIPQKIVYASYLLIVAHYFYKQRRIILKSGFLVLAAALMFFGLSVFFDVAVKTIPHQALYEDGFKLLGIVSWFLYFFNICMLYVKKRYGSLRKLRLKNRLQMEKRLN